MVRGMSNSSSDSNPEVARWLAQWEPRLPDASLYGNRVQLPARTRQARPGQSLAEKAPWLVSEWDDERNGEATPATIGASSAYAAWWTCQRDDDHRWQQPVVQRAKTDSGRRCPWCDIDARLDYRRDSTYGPLADRAHHYEVTFSDRNPVPFADASGDDRLDWLWECSEGHDFVRKPTEIEKGYACPRCWVRRQHDNQVSQRAKIGGVFKLDYPRQRSKEEIRLAAELAQVFPVDLEHDAVRIRGYVIDQPFVTPDILITSLQVAVEWDGGAHRRNPGFDRDKDEALLRSGWRVIRARVDTAEDEADVIAAPTGLNLRVVGKVMNRLLDADPVRAAAVEQWQSQGRWQGSELYESLLQRWGESARGASSYRRR